MTSYPPAAGGVTPNMIEALDQTKPWVRFLSILGFVGVALMVAGSLFFMVAGGIMAQRGPLAGQGLVLGMVYLVMALVYFFPVLFLFRYASAIASIRGGDEVAGVERALHAQKSFWRFVGILALIVLVLYVLIFGLLLVMAVLGAARRF